MPDRLIDAVAGIAAEAGALALRRQGETYRRWDKEPGHPVSDVDLEVDRFLADRLSALDPAAGWLSEETVDSAERLARERVWVVDPIDGTRDFLRGRSGWSISVALVERGRPVLGVLDAPARGERWRAISGEGAWRNGERLAASARTDLSGARVPAEMLPPKVAGQFQPVPRPNSIALRLAMLAADEVDLIASFRWGAEWDLAAAALIVAEAGGTISDANGVPLAFNRPRAETFGVIAAAPALHTAAVALFAPIAAGVALR